MRPLMLRGSFFIGLLSLLVAPAAHIASAAESPKGEDTQIVTVADSRTGDGPCGFAVQRDIAGDVELTPRIDDRGNLVLAVAPINLSGTLTNPATSKSVDINWVRQNGEIRFGTDGKGTTLEIALTGYFFRGYDTARTDLELTLPVDGGYLASFEPGQRSTDPWGHVCALLA